MSKKGFTLIELLIVIAIIGILSSIVLVALGGARDKAKDARIIADMSQIRSLAEVLYDGDYDALAAGQTDYDRVVADVSAQGGSVTLQKPTSPANSYCAYSPLNQGNWYCIDSTGVAKETSTNPGGTGYCDGTTFVCP
jgi:prepilin-type N-terminal cleavage/methylation domain-containing protein